MQCATQALRAVKRDRELTNVDQRNEYNTEEKGLKSIASSEIICQFNKLEDRLIID